MSEPFRLRPATPAELPALHELEVAIVRDGRGAVWSLDDLHDLAGFEGRHAPFFDPASPDEHHFVVAEVDGAIAGSGAVRRARPSFMRHVGIFSLQVHPAHQRRGIGRALLRACIAWAQAHGIERLELYTRSDNDRARALYESEGFTHEGTRRRFIRLPTGAYVDDVVYVRFFQF